MKGDGAMSSGGCREIAGIKKDFEYIFKIEQKTIDGYHVE
jgi:hypothetical protein